MESEYELPIIVSLTAAKNYQFVFKGEVTSKLLEVRMYDWNERQVVYEQKRKGGDEGNVLIVSYIPDFSEYYMIKPLQINKVLKEICGYIILLCRE